MPPAGPAHERGRQEDHRLDHPRWAPVYEEGLRLLGVRFRPGITPEKLSAMVSAQTSGFAQHIAGSGDDTRESRDLFVASVEALIYAALDPGDGCGITDALRKMLAG